MDDDQSAVTDDARAQAFGAQRVVQAVLYFGLVSAVVLMTVGLIAKVASGSRRSVEIDLLALGKGSTADAIMAIGVLALAFTPAAVIVALGVVWLRQRDTRFAGTALAVAAVLVIGIIVGHS